jgi:hypothetical protein
MIKIAQNICAVPGKCYSNRWISCTAVKVHILVCTFFAPITAPPPVGTLLFRIVTSKPAQTLDSITMIENLCVPEPELYYTIAVAVIIIIVTLLIIIFTFFPINARIWS